MIFWLDNKDNHKDARTRISDANSWNCSPWASEPTVKQT